MSELNYWRHRWSPQHITTVDMTGTINAPQWEPVRVLSDAELAALVTPTREQIAATIAQSLDPEYGIVDEVDLIAADAVLELMRDQQDGGE